MFTISPFLKVVTGILIRNKEWCQVGIPSITQVILSLRNDEVLCLCMLEDTAVCGTPFPSKEHIEKPEVKVTSCQHILQQLALAISICGLLFLGSMHRYMHPVQSTETCFKVLIEVSFFTDLGGNGCITSGEPHEVTVYLFWCQDIEDAIDTPE